MISPRQLLPVLPCLFWLGAAHAQPRKVDRVEEFSQARYQSTWNSQQHPAYNALHGPVNVYALRLHAEF